MENIVNLQNLMEEYNTLAEKEKEMEKTASDAVIDFLNTHCNPTDCKLTGRLGLDRPWRALDDDTPKEERARYEFRGEIEFITDDPERIAKGWKTDFGSNFHLTIREKGSPEINKGTCGSYTLKDKYQVARDRVLGLFWENYETLQAIVINKVDFEMYEKLNQLSREIDRYEDQLRRAKEEEKRQEAIKQVRKAHYLAEVSITREYGKKVDDDGYKHTDWDNVLGTKHHFYNIFVIQKITEKSIIGYEANYRGQTRRLPLDNIIYQVQTGYKVATVEEPKDYIEPLKEKAQ